MTTPESSNASEPTPERDESNENTPAERVDANDGSHSVSDVRVENSERARATEGRARRRTKTLSELNAYSDGDCFVQFVDRERLKTKEGKPYFKAVFRDRRRTVQTVIWNDSPLFDDCARAWRLGAYYKIRASLRDTNYGPKLEIRRIREVVAGDEEEGFDRNACRPCSQHAPEALASEILELAKRRLGGSPLYRMIAQIFKDRRVALLESFASRSHHRAYVGGLLEHTLSVAKIACFLCDHFCGEVADVPSNFSKELTLAGAILHDVGKILDSETTPTGARHTLAGDLLGHAALGCRLARVYGEKAGVDPDVLTRLEHLILTHARFPDWGAPSPPATLEAMVLHYADYADSTFASAVALLESEEPGAGFTSRKGPFGVPIFKPSESRVEADGNAGGRDDLGRIG